MSEQLIRTLRDTLNRAVAERSVAAFRETWLDDVAITAGSGQVLGNSRANHVRRFVATFADPSFVHGERTPTRIELNDDDGLAAEHGEWTWQHRHDGQIHDAQGDYLVMWRRVSGRWRIQSELYVMLRTVIRSE